MQQTKLISVVESLTNITIGMGIALASQYVIFPAVGIHGISHGTHIQITVYFTMVSFARSYVVRRYFDSHLHAIALRVSGVTEKLKWMFMSLVRKK